VLQRCRQAGRFVGGTLADMIPMGVCEFFGLCASPQLLARILNDGCGKEDVLLSSQQPQTSAKPWDSPGI
jgi:hypothetical protein